jgi:hypothetical protein
VVSTQSTTRYTAGIFFFFFFFLNKILNSKKNDLNPQQTYQFLGPRGKGKRPQMPT